MAAFEPKTFNYFLDQGLKTNMNPNTSLALEINTSKNKCQLESYDFSYNDGKKLIYDVPYYHPNVPQGFSAFCTDEEYSLVLDYIKKKNKTPTTTNITKIQEEITSEPEPSKKNYLCQLCMVKFKNYREHITSQEHKQNIIDNKSLFDKLSKSIRRIVDHNNYLNNMKDNLINEEGSIDIPITSKSTKKIKNLSYNLRNKNSYFEKNNDINKLIDISSPQQQVSSTAYCTFRNGLTYLEDDTNNSNITKEEEKNYKPKKRYRNEDNDYEEIYLKGKKAKI